MFEIQENATHKTLCIFDVTCLRHNQSVIFVTLFFDPKWNLPHLWPYSFQAIRIMRLSSHGNSFLIAGPLWGEFSCHQWNPSQRARNMELWCLLYCWPEGTIEQTASCQWLEMPWHFSDNTIMWRWKPISSFATCSFFCARNHLSTPLPNGAVIWSFDIYFCYQLKHLNKLLRGDIWLFCHPWAFALEQPGPLQGSSVNRPSHSWHMRQGQDLRFLSKPHSPFSIHQCHWCVKHIEAQTKWLPRCRPHFQMHAIDWKLLYLNQNFTKGCSEGSNWQQVRIGSDKVLNRQQAFIWTNDNLVYKHIYHPASMSTAHCGLVPVNGGSDLRHLWHSSYRLQAPGMLIHWWLTCAHPDLSWAWI